MRRQNETMMWSTTEGLSCFVSRYDDRRFQLRLARSEGTVKADLFSTWADARAASRRWREEAEQLRSEDWVQQLSRRTRQSSNRTFLLRR